MAKERILKEAVSNEVRKPCCRLVGTRSRFSLQRLSALGGGFCLGPALASYAPNAIGTYETPFWCIHLVYLGKDYSRGAFDCAWASSREPP